MKCEPGTPGYVRRVVTGHDENGRAVVISDGPAPFVHTSDMRPGYASTDVWRTDGTPAPISAVAPEPTLGPRRQLPAKRGSVIRINTLVPETDASRSFDKEQVAKLFAGMGNATASTYAAEGRHPMMHRTETVDYAIVLSGEITMLLDDSEVTLRAGDVLVQCGTNHAWSNRGTEPARVAFILLDGQYEPGLKEKLG
ncbi:cupin domain-containing protein [Pigmentiphaga sp. GD03639]|uniref:Cupin domain-containing protein n=1 Tax=Pigmentiphaga daeguensis TaxID=414049 RepID=A0ABP3M5G9_9BURK|nr:cupin domain-containing protein [Pigmentiphaga sp. GD03639]MDH2238459.1 cupin domain-containing protein [Pigmentiphaga sp. GD03639]